jgi:hypothetical protein
LTSELHRIAVRIRHPRTRADTQFLEAAYLELFGRPLDPAGRATYLQKLRAGMSRAAVYAELRDSEEHEIHAGRSTASLPDLRSRHPDRYATLHYDGGGTGYGYVAADPAACDWIDAAIADNGFYEKPGVWVLSIDLDKRVMAEIVAALEPASAFEVGCSSGGVLAGLDEQGIDVTGVDVSEYARARAPERIRDRIHLGDVTKMAVDRAYDVAFGLDIFEHINPNDVDAFIAAIAARVADGGFVVANVPAYGRDDVFGEVFPINVPQWREDAAAGRRFAMLEVDERGYPFHGHVVLATTEWWVEHFEAAGLQRQPDIERALQGRYGEHFREHSPARASLYVFGKQADPARVAALAARIAATPSAALAAERAAATGAR